MQRQATNLLNKIVLTRLLALAWSRASDAAIDHAEWVIDSNRCRFRHRPCVSLFRLYLSFSFYALMPFYINFTISFFTISIYLKKKVLLLSRPPFSALSSSSRARRRSEGDEGRRKKLINLSAFDFRVAPARSVIRARDHYQKKGSRRGKIRAKNTLDSSTHGDPRSFSISADLANQIE